jgi:hypothetical protein
MMMIIIPVGEDCIQKPRIKNKYKNLLFLNICPTNKTQKCIIQAIYLLMDFIRIFYTNYYINVKINTNIIWILVVVKVV